MRARDLGVVIGETPTGPNNAITDVAGVRVGHTTLDETGPPAVHTGVTVVVPHDDIWTEPVFAGIAPTQRQRRAHRAGMDPRVRRAHHRRSGSPTPTASAWFAMRWCPRRCRPAGTGMYWSLPVVGETYDGVLSDINGHHVRAEHVRSRAGRRPAAGRSPRATSAAGPA